MTTTQFPSGANIDVRTLGEKSLDYKQSEVVATYDPVVWREKAQSEWRKFPIMNQNGSGSCVAFTAAKCLSIMYWLRTGEYVPFSPRHIYYRRSNKPAAGMNANDCWKICKEGVTLEVLLKSENMTDTQMDTLSLESYHKKTAEAFQLANWLEVDGADIDEVFERVASTIQKTGKGVMVWFYFLVREWTVTPTIDTPNLSLVGTDTARHSVCAVDFCLINGKKHLIIDDSWGTSYGAAGQRAISIDFFKTRNWYAAYPTNFTFESGKEMFKLKPAYNFTLDLEFGMTNAHVNALQFCLQYEGCFPANVGTTNYFGAITKEAVQKFQDKYNIAKPSDPGYGRCGPRTRAKLNELF